MRIANITKIYAILLFFSFHVMYELTLRGEENLHFVIIAITSSDDKFFGTFISKLICLCANIENKIKGEID